MLTQLYKKLLIALSVA